MRARGVGGVGGVEGGGCEVEGGECDVQKTKKSERRRSNQKKEQWTSSATSSSRCRTLVILQELLGGTGRGVVDLADHTRVKHARGGVEGIHGRVDAELGNLGEGWGWGGVTRREHGGLREVRGVKWGG